jgi:hypothetical protein
MGVIHYITFSNGENRFNQIPYSTAQNILVNSIQSNTHREIVYHTHTLDTLRSKDWFFRLEKLKEFPINLPYYAQRDGYFNAWKPMLVKEVYDLMDNDDILYYTDSSTYYMHPFEYNLDKFFDYVQTMGHVCGAAGNDFKNGDGGYCDKKDVWDYIWDTADYDNLMLKPHILNSWFAFKKNSINKKFIYDWDFYIDDVLNKTPLCSYHHTIDQSIFNILVYKYNMNVFFNNTKHNDNKNHNIIHKELIFEPNSSVDDLKKWFYNTNEL